MRAYRGWKLTLLVLCFFTSASEAQRTTLTPRQQQDRQAIEEMHQREIEANIAFDVSALASLWTDEIVAFPPDGPPLVGREANLRFLETTAKQMADYDILSYSQDWQQVFQIDSEYAFEWGFINGRLQPVTGDEIEFHYKVLRILRRQPDGSWRVHRTSWNNAGPSENQQLEENSPQSRP